MSYLDVPLPPEVLARIDADCLRWRSSPEARERSIRRAQADRWIAEHLLQADEAVTSRSNCYVAGTETYVRRDGGLISDADVEALLAIERGQVNYVKEKTPTSVIIYYACDSGD